MLNLNRLIGAEGMLTSAEWDLLTHGRRVAWLASLDAVQVRAQASVRASAKRRPVAAVINDWVTEGYLSIERAAAALAAEVRR
jgi:hypothetical protein